MEFTAKHRFARSSPRKARLVVDMIRGKQVNDALEALMFVHRRAKVMVEKTLKSAMANAGHMVDQIRSNPEKYPNPKIDPDKFDVEDLYVKDAFVDGGPILKRWMPRAMGRATPIKKRTCHITITLSDEK